MNVAGMNWKSLLAIFAVLGIGLMLLQTESGSEFFDNTLYSFKNGVGTTLSGAFSSGGIFGPKMPSGDGFKIVLDANREAFEGQEYDLTNSSVYIKGVCVEAVKVDGVGIAKGLKDCEIEITETKGTIKYTEGATLIYTGSTKHMEVDEQVYEPASEDENKQLKVSFEVIPKQALVTDLAEVKITLESVDGDIKRFNPDNTFKSEENLEKEKVEISGFEGYFKVDNSNIITLQGDAVSVRGTGDYSSFAW